MKQIRTKKESLLGASYAVLFTVMWYSVSIRSIINNGASKEAFLLLVAGLFPSWVMFRQIWSIMYYRKLHRQAMKNPPQKGEIMSYEICYFGEDNNEKKFYRRTEYRLIIELKDKSGDSLMEIKSEPYNWPIYRALSSPEVDVYADQNKWNYVVDGFHYKRRQSDPGIFLENPWNMEPVNDGIYITQFLISAIMIVITMYHIIG